MPRLHSAVLQSLRNPGNAVLLNGLMDRDGTFNGNWKGPGGSSRYWSDAVNLKGREDLGAFAERQLFFSRQLTLRPTRGATRPQSPHNGRAAVPYHNHNQYQSLYLRF